MKKINKKTTQEKLKNANPNDEHNIKKESLGPNTKR